MFLRQPLTHLIWIHPQVGKLIFVMFKPKTWCVDLISGCGLCPMLPLVEKRERALPLIQIFSREEAQASSPQYAHYTHTMAFTRHQDTDILGPHTCLPHDFPVAPYACSFIQSNKIEIPWFVSSHRGSLWIQVTTGVQWKFVNSSLHPKMRCHNSHSDKGRHPNKKVAYFRALPKLAKPPHPLIRAAWSSFFRTSKRRFTRMTGKKYLWW